MEKAEDVPAVAQWYVLEKVQDQYKGKIKLNDAEREQMRNLIQISRKATEEEGERIYKQFYENRKDRKHLTTTKLLEQFKRAKKKE